MKKTKVVDLEVEIEIDVADQELVQDHVVDQDKGNLIDQDHVLEIDHTVILHVVDIQEHHLKGRDRLN